MSPGCSPRAPQNILGWVVSREARQSDPGALWCQGPARTAFRCAPSNASSPLLGFSSLPPPSPQRRLPRAGWAKGLQFLPRWGNRCPGTRTVHSFPLPVRVRDTQRSRSKGLSRVVRGAPSSTASWWGTPSGGWLSDLEGDGERRYGLGAGRESRLVGPRGWAATRGHLLGTGSITSCWQERREKRLQRAWTRCTDEARGAGCLGSNLHSPRRSRKLWNLPASRCFCFNSARPWSASPETP